MMRTKALLIWCMLLSLSIPLEGHTRLYTDSIASGEPQHVVNFGFKGGFTASLFLVSDFSINGERIDEVQNNYKIGYFASFFMRINFERHFLQPEISYTINRCNITFMRPPIENMEEDVPPQEAGITYSIHSIDIPVIYGYHIIKEGPYGLAIFMGPKFRYIWDKKSEVTFENFNLDNIHEELYPLNLNLTVGVSVNISRIFFDFRYDIGLHNISKKITYTLPEATPPTGEGLPDREIRFHRRDNVLSFSLGVFF